MYWHHQTIIDTAKKVGFRLATGIGVLEALYEENKEVLKNRICEYIETYQHDELITPCTLIHSTYTVGRETLLLVKQINQEYGVVFMTHAAESRSELKDVLEQTGKTPINYLEELGMLTSKSLLAHGVLLTIVKYDCWLNERLQLRTALHQSQVGCRVSHVWRICSPMVVNVAIGTDGCASNNNLDMWEEMHLASLVQKGVNFDPTVLPSEQVLYMATMGGAIALNLDDKIGSLEAGKRLI